MLGRNIPKCSKCIYYRFYGHSKNYDLGTCTKFLSIHHIPLFAEYARNMDTLCGYNGIHFKERF